MMTSGTTIYGAISTPVNIVPEWMKNERYEYCEPYFEHKLAKRTGKKKFSRFTHLLSFFL